MKNRIKSSRIDFENYKKMAKGKKSKPKAKKLAPKRKVSRQNQHRVEYKDRISSIQEDSMLSNAGSVTAGPENSLILVPLAMTDTFTQGSSNGQVEGNNILPKFCNMKVRIDFSKLPQNVLIDAGGTSGSQVTQRYDIYIRQVLIKQSIDEYLTGTYSNATSGRDVPAFPNLADIPRHWTDTAKKYLFNARIQPDFLSYEKRMDNHIRILKSWRVLGDTTANFTDRQGTAYAGTDQTKNISPDKHYTFNWTMPKDKTLLSPDSTGGDFALSKMWVPAVIITMERKHKALVDETLNAVPLQPLLVSSRSHFTYTDA